MKNNNVKKDDKVVVKPVVAPVVAETTQPVKKKWFEENNKGWGFEIGDMVYIGLTHPNGVADRFAIALEPSEKPNHIKAQMQNPKTGELQRSVVVIDNAHLILISKGGLGMAVLGEHGINFVLDNSGIYKTKATIDKENAKNGIAKPAEAVPTDEVTMVENDLAQAQ